MPSRHAIVSTIGEEYVIENIEAGEFSYPKAFKQLGKDFKSVKTGTYETVDIRFVKDDVTILVETKQDITVNPKKFKEQLAAYVKYERVMQGDFDEKNKIIAILASTSKSKIIVYRGAVDGTHEVERIKKIVPMDDFVDIFNDQVNNKEAVMGNTAELNNILHKHAIKEDLRSQFVGTCLLCLKNGLKYEGLESTQIIAGITTILERMLDKKDSVRKKDKIERLSGLFEKQVIKALETDTWSEILYYIEDKILPFIYDKNFEGQDLLNLFFITFNKYVGKADKNQAFTPDHITDFMSKVTGVNRNSRVLDYCCGSGSFLVKAMTHEFKDIDNDPYLSNKERDELKDRVKKEHIYGIEFENKAFGLSVTNMLIHGDGNSNVMQDSCFNQKLWIQKIARPNVILLNPPYNCQRISMDAKYSNTWKASQKEDPSKGLYFVKWISDVLFEAGLKAKMAVLLPVSCAISNDSQIVDIRNELLEHNTLDAVFSLPNEVFYPGAAASACCMVFNMGTPHNTEGNPDTFFGYFKDDGFKKKKNLGRVEQIKDDGTSKWTEIEDEWLRLYKNRIVKAGFSAVQHIDQEIRYVNDKGKEVVEYPEWICEAYMETDYSKLTDADFQRTLNNYLAFLVKEGKVYEA